LPLLSITHPCTSIFFLFVVRPPPTSTLFPYTTLFRSISGAVLVDVGRAVADPLPPRVHGDPHVELDLAHFERSRVAMSHEIADQNRKSTRLNSSHVAISYAVFCLKKKKLAHR